ncbi:hypothetical protein P261_02920 [Lachnospiraceae bacterium TWA4]|nr:hypothetical protein P261_02920 [Lachnospiraceae bacterium TWA4]
MLKSRQNWVVKSNREAGDGRADVIMYPRKLNVGYIFEFKYATDAHELEDMAKVAIKQVEQNQYEKFFLPQKLPKIVCYGISFYKKQCHVEVKLL